LSYAFASGAYHLRVIYFFIISAAFLHSREHTTCIQATALHSTFSIRGLCTVRYHRIRESRYRTIQLLIS
jgi:hypothetical protein